MSKFPLVRLIIESRVSGNLQSEGFHTEGDDGNQTWKFFNLNSWKFIISLNLSHNQLLADATATTVTFEKSTSRQSSTYICLSICFIPLATFLLAYLGKGEERNGYDNEKKTAEQKSAPPHADPSPVRRIWKLIKFFSSFPLEFKIREAHRCWLRSPTASPCGKRARKRPTENPKPDRTLPCCTWNLTPQTLEKVTTESLKIYHALCLTDVHRAALLLHMVIDVRRAQGEQWTAAAAQQKLRQHEEQNWTESWWFGIKAIVSSAGRTKKFFTVATEASLMRSPQIIMRCQGRIG